MNNYKPSDYSTQIKSPNEGEYSLIELFNPTTNESLCKINVVDGKLSFSGNLDESAQRFMELVRNIYNTSYKPCNKVIAEWSGEDVLSHFQCFTVNPDRQVNSSDYINDNDLSWLENQEIAINGKVYVVVTAVYADNGTWRIYAK